jgi:hypothetical protein
VLGVIRVKPGVEFTTIAPGGFAILAALETAAFTLEQDLWITSACDGEHSGPDDPHHRGEAYDVRSHDQRDKKETLLCIMDVLHAKPFYGFLEDEGTDNEHFHIQVNKGASYP